MLPKSALNKAADYIYNFGRDIDVLLFEYYFKKQHSSKVINQLLKHLNDDGGFGKGLELDFMYPGSTPLSTTHALDILRRLHIYSNNHITTDALEYLEKTKNYKNGWSCITKEVNEWPRASWWSYSPAMKETYTLNPTAEIIGYFYLFGGGIYRNTTHEMLDACYSYLKNPDNGNEMHELISLMRMVRMLPSSVGSRFVRFLRPRLNSSLCYDTGKYNTYVFTPLNVFESPDDTMYDIFRNQIEENLDYLVDSQNADGSWSVNWHWDRDEHVFDKQIPLITAHITLENIIKLKSFKRIGI